jgi:FG-GAP repeat
MFFGNRRPRVLTARQHDNTLFQPCGEQLEAKILMAIDLGGTAAPSLPFSATAPYGIDMTGTTSSAGAGYSVADVADLTGNNNYDSLVIGAPGVTGSPPTTVSSTGTGTVYVVFGSSYAQSSSNLTATQNWLNTNAGPNLVANDRVGNLGTLGATSQTNPISGSSAGNLTYPFTGVTFTGPASFGASVSGVALTSSINGIIVGAPNANNGNGEAFLIYGNFAADAGQTINVASPPSNLTVITITDTTATGTSGALGFSVAGGSNILGDGAGDVIVGAPSASVAPTNTTTPVVQNTGVVYVISFAALPGSTSTVDVSTLLTSQTIAFAGANSGDRAGSSVADGGDVNGASGNIDDLLIGATQADNSAGAAYLVYGGSNLASLRTIVNGVPFISLANVVGGTGTGNVPGAIIDGPAGGSDTGFSVAAGGDFNGDGFADILVGTPSFNGSSTTLNQGEVTMLYGAASTSGAYLTGTIPLSAIPSSIAAVQIIGANQGDAAGYAVSQVGVINAGQATGILIGAPGYNGDEGTVYLIPGRANFTGSFSLANISTTPTAPLVGLQFTLTTPGSPSALTYFGASLSGRLQGTQRNTADLDNEADFIIGSPGYNGTGSNPLAGGAQIVQSGFLQVPIPQSLTVTVQIGVGAPFAPFSINATTPTTLQIFVFGSTATTPNFMPVDDIDPTTVKVNGIAFPNATIAQDTNTGDYLDGIPDAIITISPRSALNLSNGSQKITISGLTLAGSPLPNYTWTGTATVSVTGGSNSVSTSVAAAPATGPVLFTQYISPFGANQYSPSLTALSALTYQPIPLSVALAEYLPAPGFRTRLYAFNHPNRKIKTNRGQNQGRASGINTLSSHVFSRGAFHAQKNYAWTHKAAKVGDVTGGVIPIQSRRQTFDDNLIR